MSAYLYTMLLAFTLLKLRFVIVQAYDNGHFEKTLPMKVSSPNSILFVHIMTHPDYIRKNMDFWESRCRYLYDSANADSVVFTPSHNHQEIFVKGKREGNIWYPVPGCKQVIYPMDINVSTWVATHPSVVAKCYSRVWTREYALYSGAFFAYHLLRVPLLQKYEIYVKVDVDICMQKKLPVSLLIPKNPTTLFSHTGIRSSSDCEREVLQQVRDYRRERMDATEMSSWCYKSSISQIVYGNFVMFNSTFMTSKPVLELTEYLYNKRGIGYFEYRWGDQALIPSLLCGVVPLPGVQAMSLDPRINNLEKLRDNYFTHKKKGHKCNVAY